MVNIPALIASENSRWQAMTINPARLPLVKASAARLIRPEAKAIYQQIEAETRVPWPFIAVVHEREASQNFACSLAQGDRWDRVSVNVPRGRGPFKDFKAAAYDALVNCAPKAARWPDWSIGGTLVIGVEYNGLGYAARGVPSPYVWASTNQYIRGKFIADGVYDPNHVDTQIGIAPLLFVMQQLDPSIRFGIAPPNAPTTKVGPGKPPVPVVPPVHDAPHSPSIIHPAAGSLGDAIAQLFGSLFNHLHH